MKEWGSAHPWGWVPPRKTITEGTTQVGPREWIFPIFQRHPNFPHGSRPKAEAQQGRLREQRQTHSLPVRGWWTNRSPPMLMQLSEFQAGHNSQSQNQPFLILMASSSWFHIRDPAFPTPRGLLQPHWLREVGNEMRRVLFVPQVIALLPGSLANNCLSWNSRMVWVGIQSSLSSTSLPLPHLQLAPSPSNLAWDTQTLGIEATQFWPRISQNFSASLNYFHFTLQEGLELNHSNIPKASLLVVCLLLPSWAVTGSGAPGQQIKGTIPLVPARCRSRLSPAPLPRVPIAFPGAKWKILGNINTKKAALRLSKSTSQLDAVKGVLVCQAGQ